MTSRRLVLVWGLLWCHSLRCTTAKLSGETETDVDNGHDWDIFDINKEAGLDLLEGDIEKSEGRNSIVDEQYRWPTTVPYYLEESLDMNAKGVILKALEQFRLKTCINFTPWEGEKNYISVYKGSGCFSSVGNRGVGKQRLSIGSNCDRLGTVEHELLHALGFWHEQSRADRDDYVNIMWDRIKPGNEHNFGKYDDKVSSSLGVAYDYGSVMHYSKTAFDIGSEPTIVTKIPYFMDVIGQRMEFSDGDLRKVNRLYSCTTSSTFVETCDFEKENICGAIQGPGGNREWEQRSAVSGGPLSDFTTLGQCKNTGYFMHFSTATGQAGDNAFLESRLFYPQPGDQCLQFFLHNSSSADDVLMIWVREYDQLNPDGKLRLEGIKVGGARGSWELHHVPINMKTKSRVVFEGVKGSGPSTAGGLSLDDINLWSGRCPQHIWHIRNMTGLLATMPVNTKLYSPRFLSPKGYNFQIGVYLNGRSHRQGYMGVYLYLTSGPNDDRLKWPCPWHQATMALMDQQSDIRQSMSMHRMVTTDPSKLSSNGDEFYWDNPRKVGSLVEAPEGDYYRGPGTGTSTFLTHSRLRSRKFIKGDDAYFLLSLDGEPA